MQIGEVIRKHRKLKSMTQEEMAKRLGVTAPAVNKWENSNSFPAGSDRQTAGYHGRYAAVVPGGAHARRAWKHLAGAH